MLSYKTNNRTNALHQIWRTHSPFQCPKLTNLDSSLFAGTSFDGEILTHTSFVHVASSSPYGSSRSRSGTSQEVVTPILRARPRSLLRTRLTPTLTPLRFHCPRSGSSLPSPVYGLQYIEPIQERISCHRSEERFATSCLASAIPLPPGSCESDGMSRRADLAPIP